MTLVDSTTVRDIAALIDRLEVSRLELAQALATQLHPSSPDLERLVLLKNAIASLAESTAAAKKKK